ncbi:PREDICTED: F-box/LRR-repeat protein At3g58940-like [Camelina sativa]|uniref:F-box/LRR-repeat protein At3g58940-like n=1 Tax=Camelina sativa TaxID=90675 RepID=A0ABM0Z1R8_CAMSA|nr:PREDICTED: F-box/LRR-repeat protein At3g58940-like [Camelina sativa]
MDWFGSLPDEVICYILSFLTTKEAALTSVLSQRWLNLWTLVPNLDVDDSVFLHPEEGKRERDGMLQSFMDFVDRVLAVQGGDSPVKKFSLKCQTGIDKGLLHHDVTDKCGDACDCISREDKGRSPLSCPVKKLQVRGFRGTVREKEMIRHFLEYFPCLDEMEMDAEENDSTNFEVPRLLKVLAYKLHDVVSTEVVRHSKIWVRSGSCSETQMDDIYSEFAPRNKECIYDMFFIMRRASSPVPPPLREEMSDQGDLQMQLDAANAKLADLKERQQEQEAQRAGYEAQMAGYEAMFDIIVDQNPLLESAWRDRERAKAASSGQEMTEKKRDYDVLFEIILEQNPMLASAIQARHPGIGR